MTGEQKLDLILEKLDRMDEDIKGLRHQQMKDTEELKAMDTMIFEEVERIHEIMLKKTDELEKKIG